MEDPKKCQFQSSSCGNYPPRRDKIGSVILRKLDENVASLFNVDDDTIIGECDLISMRSPVPLNQDGLICATHRFTLGVCFRASTKCRYNEHPETSHSKGMKISWNLYKFVKTRDHSFMIGSLICKKCQSKLNALKLELEMEWEENVDSSVDLDYAPLESVISENEKLKRREQLDVLASIFKIDRVRFQANKDLMTMSRPSLSYFREVHKQFEDRLTDTICSLIAPGQEEKMKSLITANNRTESDDSIIGHLKDAFATCCTRKARLSILTLLPKSYSKSEICEAFQCSHYEIVRARSILKIYGTCAEEPQKERVYSRLSFEKAQHFIDFLFSTGLLQEVAYGTVKLKFDSGDKMSVTNTILNGIHEHAIKEYIIYCKELNYHPLGATTLRKVLLKMKPRIRKKTLRCRFICC